MFKDYKEFINNCDEDFIKEVHGSNKRDIFKNRVIKSCTLEELEKLDNVFISGSKNQ